MRYDPEQDERRETTRRLTLSERLGEVRSGGLALRPGAVILGDYRVERLVGEGGLGSVFQVRSLSTGEWFALKTVRDRAVGEARRRRLFLRELLAWSQLPEHPNLVALRFFRTVRQEILIFAEYVAGGSLGWWIREGRLAHRDAMLRVVLQTAWGLGSAHEAGITHCDVKPGNVLIAAASVPCRSASLPDGAGAAGLRLEAKITDFHLARARQVIEALPAETRPAGPEEPRSPMGRTPAFCSPEQATRERLTPATDVWSWGLTVLTLFTGGVFWKNGTGAAAALHSYRESDIRNRQLPVMPQGLERILLRCFEERPEQRWPSMQEVVRELEELPEIRSLGSAIVRRRVLPAACPLDPAFERRTPSGGTWPDPADWLRRAREETGDPLAGAESFLASRAATRRGRAIADLAVLEEVRLAYESHSAQGDRESIMSLARVSTHSAYAHEFLGDLEGAAGLLADAAGILEDRLAEAPSLELWRALARVNTHRALVLSSAGDGAGSLPLYERSLQAIAAAREGSDPRALDRELAQVYLNRALTLNRLGDSDAALASSFRSVEILERLAEEHGDANLHRILAKALMDQGAVLWSLGRLEEAEACCDRSIRIQQRLVREEGREDVLDELALSYTSKALSRRACGDLTAALEAHRASVRILEDLVRRGRGELEDDLALAYLNLGVALGSQGDGEAALRVLDRALEIYERRVRREGRREISTHLARCYAAKAQVLVERGRPAQGEPLYERAVRLLESLESQEDRRDVRMSLGAFQARWAETLARLERPRKAAAVARRAAENLDIVLASGESSNQHADLEALLAAMQALQEGDPDPPPASDRRPGG